MMRLLRRLAAPLLWAQDRLADLTFVLSCLAVAAIGIITAVDVVLRYFFRAPLTWGGDSVMLALLAVAFLAAPSIARGQAHVAMTFVVDAAGPRLRMGLGALAHLAGFAVTGICGYVATLSAIQHFERGVRIIAVTAWPRWWVTAIIAYGLVSMSLYFLRHLLGLLTEREGEQPEEAARWRGTLS